MPKFTKKFILKFISNFFIFIGLVLILGTYGPIVTDEVWYQFKELLNKPYFLQTDTQPKPAPSLFAKYLSPAPVFIEPVNKDFSLVIEKIGVNAPIVKDVYVTDPASYEDALKTGVAHAALSQYPSKNRGNVYLFAHSSLNFWNLGNYATVLNLLRKLEIGDKIFVFYEGKQYTYQTVNTEVLEGFNTFPLTRTVLEPTLTIQTCHPPGTTLNRLVVTAKLIDVK